MPSTPGSRLQRWVALLLIVAAALPGLALAARTPESDVGGDPAAERLQRTTPDTPLPAADPFAPAPADAGGGAGGDEDGAYGIRGGDGDWMAENGLRSPLCPTGQGLPCAKSGLISSDAPPGRYAFDIHVDAGLKGNPIAKNIQDIFGGIWTGLVAILAALMGALEWAFDLDLIGRANIAPRLNQVVSQWLLPVSLLAVMWGGARFAVVGMWKGQVGRAVSELVASVAMFAALLGILAHPNDTVGWTARQSSELGKSAAITATWDPNGGSAQQASVLNQGLKGLWTGIVTKPFALLEFGDVDWGTNPDKLDRDLKRAAEKIAAEQSAETQRAVRNARTNADLFLIWPTNSDERNGITEGKCAGGNDCLLRVLCGNDDDNDCKGENADRAEQRTESGTWERAGMVLVLTLTLLPVIFLLGVLAFGLLSSAILTVYYLLVLAYFGFLSLLGADWARRKIAGYWRSLGEALAAFVIYGVALGLTMTVFAIVNAMAGLGWVIQWVLMTLALVGLWKKRHEIGSIVADASPKRVVGTTRRHADRATRRLRDRTGNPQSKPGQRGLGGGADVSFAPARGTRPSPMPAFAIASVPGGAQLATAAAKTRGAAALAKASAPTGAKGRLAMLAGGLVGGPGGAAFAGAALSGARGRAARNAGRMEAIHRGEIPKKLKPREQVDALLTGQRATARRRARTAALDLPEQLEAQRRLERDRGQVLEDLGALPAGHPRRPELEQRAAGLLAELRTANAAVDESNDAVVAGKNADRHLNPDGTFTTAAKARAERWLNAQAASSPEDRDYRSLGQVRHVAPEQYDRLPRAERRELHRKIDEDLARRTAGSSRPPRPPAPPTPASDAESGRRPRWRRSERAEATPAEPAAPDESQVAGEAFRRLVRRTSAGGRRQL